MNARTLLTPRAVMIFFRVKDLQEKAQTKIRPNCGRKKD
jgi:hypothetical protein